jgi:hypothetical protein
MRVPRKYLQLLLPRLGNSLYYFVKCRAKVSRWAEVELTGKLTRAPDEVDFAQERLTSVRQMKMGK